MPIQIHRDRQKWLHDWMVKETGKVFHFQGDDRGSLPRSVRQHDMISKHLGKLGLRVRALADQERAAGHAVTALELYFEAASVFASAQHPIFENNAEKRALHSASIGCYDAVRELAPYPIEHLEIPWGERRVYANLHLLPDRRPAPCVIFIPGCDMTKEMYPYPLANQAHQRGMHLISVDGPGQGENNLEGTRLTADNYPSAMSAVVDHLEGRPEVVSDQIGLYGLSFGSFWSTQTVAREHRIKAHVGSWASICDKRYLFDVESPRYKWLFAYLTGARSEREIDEIAEAMALDDVMGDITCPTLLTVGEYDPRSPLSEVIALYDKMSCERELWVHEDQHHMCSPTGRAQVSDRGMWNIDTYSWMLDWLRDRLQGRPVERSGEVTYLVPTGSGPNGSSARPARSWLEAYDVDGPSLSANGERR
jgi:cephalosporin-C deacetylase-like acetyl esterase